MPNSVWSLLGMLASVVVILALAYFATRWIGTRGAFYTGGGRSAAGKLSVLHQLSLGRNERLVLIRLQERCLLLGVSAGGVTVLTELTAEEAGQWISQPDAPIPPSFLEALKSSLPKKK